MLDEVAISVTRTAVDIYIFTTEKTTSGIVMVLQDRATSKDKEIPEYHPTPCRFCNYPIFLSNVDLGDFYFRWAFDFTTGRKHVYPEALRNYIRYNLPQQQQVIA